MHLQVWWQSQNILSPASDELIHVNKQEMSNIAFDLLAVPIYKMLTCATTSRVLYYLQNLAVITGLEFVWKEIQPSVEFELHIKNHWWNGPLVNKWPNGNWFYLPQHWAQVDI